MKLLDTTATLFTKAEAIKAAAELNATDDWDYRPVSDPTGFGKSFIEVYDKNGNFVAKM